MPGNGGRRIVLATFGSLGDLHPYLAVGRGLRERGHSVAVASFKAYGARVEREGLEFVPVRPHLDPTDRQELQRALHPRTGASYIVRDVAMGNLRDSLADFREGARGADLIVSHPLAYCAQLAARASGRPWASVALAPLSLYSVSDPPVYAGLPFADAIAGLGPTFQRALLRLVELGSRAWLRPYRELEAELRLPPGPNPVVAGQHSPHLVLALFSPVLAPPQPDWPARTRATGFPFYAHDDGVSPEIYGFLAEVPPPVVFTLGSAAVGTAGRFFEHSAEAAGRLGVRALLLVGHDPENRPRALPPGVLAVPYAPHAAVFPRASVIVHQGGIGTTAEAMRAGRPMLVVPYSHDQPDHARRLRRLGLARSLPSRSYTTAAAAREIGRLLADPSAAARARDVAAVVSAERGVARACDAIGQLLGARA